ncbi:hypothetical protein GCM10010217_74890 [Streptomyces tubercidicus]
MSELFMKLSFVAADIASMGNLLGLNKVLSNEPFSIAGMGKSSEFV